MLPKYKDGILVHPALQIPPAFYFSTHLCRKISQDLRAIPSEKKTTTPQHRETKKGKSSPAAGNEARLFTRRTSRRDGGGGEKGTRRRDARTLAECTSEGKMEKAAWEVRGIDENNNAVGRGSLRLVDIPDGKNFSFVAFGFYFPVR